MVRRGGGAQRLHAAALLALAAIVATPLSALAAGWAITPSPNDNGSGAQENVLNAVACPSPTLCLAVGRYQAANGSTRTLAERWDGKVKSPGVV